MIKKETMKNFKPQLLPNEPSGEAPDWEERLKNPKDWLASYKLDGARVELMCGESAKGRSLKDIKNVQIQRMSDELWSLVGVDGDILECEFYSDDMNFAELMHFFRSEDVTSGKTLKKYTNLWNKTQGDPELGWPFPGRDLKWATTWHDSLKLYAFDFVSSSHKSGLTYTKKIRSAQYAEIVQKASLDFLEPIAQTLLTSVDMFYQMYDQAMLNNWEGVVVVKRESEYKYGRITMKANEAYKAKDNNQEYDGVIIDIPEATIARPGSEKTINELGRSKTSQKKDDRVPSGIAKGFLVELEDGKQLTVSLNGYTQVEKKFLLFDKKEFIGRTIRFTAMPPVKPTGLPRHSHFTKGNFRDDK